MSTASNPQESCPAQLALAKAAVSRGARWFYVIAAFSVLGSVLPFMTLMLRGSSILDTNWRFVFSLLVAMLAGFAACYSEWSFCPAYAIGVALAAAAFLCLMAHFTKKGKRTALIVGMSLYLVDGIFWLLAGAWYPAGFHALALGMLATTFPAIRRYEKAQQDAQAQRIPFTG